MKKVIFAVLMIAIVGSLVGIGTWAYFSDYETSEDNYFRAGSMDLKVDGEDDPDVAKYFEVGCLKPGDMDSQLILLRNVGCVNGYADLKFVVTLNSENGMPEPEQEVDTTWGPDGGELCEALLITVEVDEDRDMVMDKKIIDDAPMCTIDGVNWDLDTIIQAGEYESGGVNYIYVKISYQLPGDTGNEIMTDICGFDIEFSLTQLRPGAEYFNLEVCSVGCCPIDTTVGDVAAGACETFSVLEGRTIQVTADDSDVCCEFVSWAGDIEQGAGVNPNNVVMTGNKTVTATCEDATYDLTVNSVGCCPIDVGAPVNAQVAAGTSQTFTDIACNTVISLDADDSAADCTFVNWTGDASGTNPSTTVTMNADKTVNGNCQGVGYNLTVTSDGCCPIDVGAPVNQQVAAGASQTFLNIPGGTDVEVSADDSDACCDFVSWSDAGVQTHDVHMDGNKSVTATCVLLTSDLTVISSGCCPIDVSWDGQGDTVPAGGQLIFENIPCCTNVTVSADDSDICCDFVSWDDQGAKTHTIHMDGTNKTVTATCVLLDSDLYVNSIGCCFVEVYEDGNLVYTLSPGESWSDTDVPCCVNVDVVAVPPPPWCFCDDIELDLVSKGCLTASVHMDGNDHTFDVYCHSEEPPVPPECCWSIYYVEYYECGTEANPIACDVVPEPGVTEPNAIEYYATHCDLWREPGYTENFGPLVGDFVITDPCCESHTSFFDINWQPCMPLRWNQAFLEAEVGMIDMGSWKSRIDLDTWKSVFEIALAPPLPAPTLAVYALSEGPPIVINGDPGWPYALGDEWLSSVYIHPFATVSWTHSKVIGTEVVLGPPLGTPMECYVVQSWMWDPIHQVDVYPSGVTYMHNDYGSAIMEVVMPGILISGWEFRSLIWYCMDPPFPPWEL